MGAVLSFFRPAPVARGDWSQQELAEFYRVEAALTQSGLRVTSDRGLSDEADPWFVFCRFDGDVILHFARIDDLYVVASEAFERPLQGPDFRALLNAVAAEHPTLVPLPRPDAQGRRGNLVLHPAALLAAIVATVAFQLAGGDAMAGELATDGSGPPMQAGAGLPDIGSHALDGPAGDPRDHGSAQAGEDEGRYARHAVILSALALISTTIPSDHAAGPGLSAFGETTSAGSQGKAASKHVPEADGLRESAHAQKLAAAASDTVIVETAAEQAALARAELILASSTQAPTNVNGFSLTALNILGLGAAGGQAIAAVHAAESAAPVTSILALRNAARAPSVAVAAEKAAPPTTVSESTPAPSPAASPAASPGTSAAAPATASAQTAANVTASETSTPAAISHTTGSGALSAPAASASGTTVKATGSSGVAEMSPTTTGTSVSAASTAVQTASVTAVTYTTNTGVRSALNSFIDQYSGAGTGSSSADTVSATKSQAGDTWLTDWAKSIGTRASSDVLGSLIKYTSGGTSTDTKSADAKDAGALSADQTAGSSKLTGSTGTTATIAHTTGTAEAATGSETAAGLVTAAATATKALLTATLASADSKAAASAADTHVGEGASKTAGTPSGSTGTDKIVAAGTTSGTESHAGTDGTAAAPTPSATPTGTDKAAAAGTASGTESHTGTGATTAGDTSGATTGTSKQAVTGTASGTESHAGTGGATAAPTPSAPAATDKPAVVGTDTATLDTTKLKSAAFVASSPTLDDQGRQLIARFLDATAQVQTIITEHSFVMIDMDASHYASPDFVLRTWSIGHDVEISIVGLASDTYLAAHSGIAG